jgi:carbon monoxide dehydrogenase subunit G
MHFEGEFRVPGTPDDVIRRFADVERMTRCMPGAVIDGRDEQGNYLGGMLVAFGPRRSSSKVASRSIPIWRRIPARCMGEVRRTCELRGLAYA